MQSRSTRALQKNQNKKSTCVKTGRRRRHKSDRKASGEKTLEPMVSKLCIVIIIFIFGASEVSSMRLCKVLVLCFTYF